MEESRVTKTLSYQNRYLNYFTIFSPHSFIACLIRLFYKPVLPVLPFVKRFCELLKSPIEDISSLDILATASLYYINSLFCIDSTCVIRDLKEPFIAIQLPCITKLTSNRKISKISWFFQSTLITCYFNRAFGNHVWCIA